MTNHSFLFLLVTLVLFCGIPNKIPQLFEDGSTWLPFDASRKSSVALETNFRWSIRKLFRFSSSPAVRWSLTGPSWTPTWRRRCWSSCSSAWGTECSRKFATSILLLSFRRWAHTQNSWSNIRWNLFDVSMCIKVALMSFLAIKDVLTAQKNQKVAQSPALLVLIMLKASFGQVVFQKCCLLVHVSKLLCSRHSHIIFFWVLMFPMVWYS